MIKELVKDEAILSTPCEPATAADAEIAQDLVDTLLSIEDAACLAANQIGVTKAICALADDEGNTLVMYNPKVLFGMGAFKAEESCLTREGSVRVTRFVKIKVAYDELVDGELKPRKRDFVEWPASSFSTCATTARASWFKLPNRQIVSHGHTRTWMLPCSAFCPVHRFALRRVLPVL